MPLYEYACPRCGAVVEICRKVADRHRATRHCGVKTKLVIVPPMIRSTFAPFRAVTGDRRVINNETERRKFMREFRLAEIGNDPSMAPPQESEKALESRRKRAFRDLQQLKDLPNFGGDE